MPTKGPWTRCQSFLACRKGQAAKGGPLASRAIHILPVRLLSRAGACQLVEQKSFPQQLLDQPATALPAYIPSGSPILRLGDFFVYPGAFD